MARTTQGKKALQIVMPENAYEAIKEYAEKHSTEDKTVFVSDVVREALAEFFDRHDKEVNFDVDRGGYRGRKNKKVHIYKI